MTTSIDTSVSPLSPAQGGTGFNNTTNVISYAANTNIDSSGRIILPARAGFSAYLNTTISNATGDGTSVTIPFDESYFDNGSVFDGTTFTAPVSGNYLITYNISTSGYLVAHTSMQAWVNCSARGNVISSVLNSAFVSAAASGAMIISGSTTIQLAASDTATLKTYVAGGTKVISIFGLAAGYITQFSAYLLD